MSPTRSKHLKCLACGYHGDRCFVEDEHGVWRDPVNPRVTPSSCACDCGSTDLALASHVEFAGARLRP